MSVDWLSSLLPTWLGFELLVNDYFKPFAPPLKQKDKKWNVAVTLPSRMGEVLWRMPVSGVCVCLCVFVRVGRESEQKPDTPVSFSSSYWVYYLRGEEWALFHKAIV